MNAMDEQIELSANARPRSEAVSDPEPPDKQALGRINKGNLALGCMFVAAIICVYVLRPKSLPTEASASPQTDELAVEDLLARLKISSTVPSDGAKAMDIIQKSYYQAKRRQVPLEDLRGNPLIFHLPQPTTLPASSGAPSQRPRAADMQAAQRQALAIVKDLRLQAILKGSNGYTAIISDCLLTEGEEIRGWTVERIDDAGVLLKWQDETHVLELAP